MMGQSTGGGSTITQQLAKQLYPRDTARNSSYEKIKLGVSKFKEWQTAIKLERSYTKEEIITMYLNKFDFSYNAIGIRSAATGLLQYNSRFT
jgi:penicillin-binding protein 1A